MALAGRRLGKKALTATGLTKHYGTTPVVDGVSIRLEPGDRLGMLGPNGAGKSTLLDMLAGRTTPDAGSVQWGETVHVGYYDQLGEHLDGDMRLIDFIEEEAALIRTDAGERVEAAKMLEWFLFPRAMQRATIRSLSGGERRRLYLLRTLVHQPNVLLLDEPTNDLDIQTLNVLEEFLDRFGGCLIVVSHDRYFLDRTVDYLRYMEDGKLGPQYPSPYETFVRLRRQEQAGQIQEAKKPKKTGNAGRAGEPDARVRKLSWNEQRELESLESHIQALEADKAALMEEMAATGEDYLTLQELSGRVDLIDSELSTAVARWFELSEIAEIAQG
jgi:ABC transport system ATP-binding/permease protein